jgi:hypothetical protein
LEFTFQCGVGKFVQARDKLKLELQRRHGPHTGAASAGGA